jgi:hypothetical protein
MSRWKHVPPILMLGFLLGMPPAGGHGEVDHYAWEQVLKEVVQDGTVDYAGLATQPGLLPGYLEQVANAHVAHLDSAESQLAFWINAYNACAIMGVLDHYPVRSVKEVNGFFDRLRYPVAGESLTLNEIEARGRALGDWRIHFALVCASSSCPPLRNEAYVPERLNEQLAEQTRRFLADEQRGLRVESAGVWVSRMFKWYELDFMPAGGLSAGALLPILRPYLELSVADAWGAALLRDPKLPLRFLDYDWALNERRTH